MGTVFIDRLTTLTDEQLAEAKEWFASHSKSEQRDMVRRALNARRNFGIKVPRDDGADEWAQGESFAALCYDDYLA